MKTIKTVICAGLFLLLSNAVCLSQNSAENDVLSFRMGSWSNQYFVGNQLVSYNSFVEKMGERSEPSSKMFKSGRSLNIAGVTTGCVGAFFVGYDVGGRLAGAKGNTALLIGGGAVLVGGLIMAYSGERKMKKALTLYQNASGSLSISPAQTGIGLCVNF